MYQDLHRLDNELDGDLEDILLETHCQMPSKPTTLQDKFQPLDETESYRLLSDLKQKGILWWWRTYVEQQKRPVQSLLLLFGVSYETINKIHSDKRLESLLRSAALRLLRERRRISTLTTVNDALSLIRHSKKILIVTGAGISVNCGIPDFRSENGVYADIKMNSKLPLVEPQEMFHIQCFEEEPNIFYSYAHKMYPRSFKPSRTHRFIKLIEDRGKLLRNYTQNIDNLESLAGVQKVLQCHGSFATATCLQCRVTVPGRAIEKDILEGTVALCESCLAHAKKLKSKKKKRKRRIPWCSDESSDDETTPPYVMKPDITFFGEKLSSKFDSCLARDREEVDLLLIIGTSLKVAPVSDILAHIPHSVPQILINKTLVDAQPDIALLGDADVIIDYITTQLSWKTGEDDLVARILEPIMDSKSERIWRFAQNGTTLPMPNTIKDHVGTNEVSRLRKDVDISSVREPTERPLNKRVRVN